MPGTCSVTARTAVDETPLLMERMCCRFLLFPEEQGVQNAPARVVLPWSCVAIPSVAAGGPGGTPATSAANRLVGVISAVCKNKGYGFIRSHEIFRQYGRCPKDCQF